MICPECGKKLPDNAVKCNKCGKVFKEAVKSSETEEYLKKEKEKAAVKAQKLSEKKLKDNQKSASKNPEKNAKAKKILKIVIPCVAVLLAAAIAVTLVIRNKNKKDREYIELNCPEKLIEYTYPEVSADEAVMTLGDINISKAEYEFFYRQSFSNTQNYAQLDFKQYMGEKLGEEYDENANYYDEYYADYAKGKKNIFDFSKPINSQTSSALDEDGKEITWQEYIRNDAIKTMTNYHVKFELARKAGIELTDDVRYQVYSHIEGLRDAIKGSGYQNLTQYLKILFGDACDEEFFKNELIREYMASKYDTVCSLDKTNSYSDDEIKPVYDKERAKYDFVDLSVYEVTGKDAEKTAKKILKDTKTVDDFTAAIQKNTGMTTDKRYMPAVPKSYVDGQYAEKLGSWAFSKDRKEGDKDVFKTANGYTVAVLHTPMYTRENCVSFREIVIPKTDESGNYLSETELAKAKEKADEIYSEWQESDKSENTFSYYAIVKSGSSTASSGGLVPVAVAEELSENLKKWVTDKSRKAGDTELIDTDSSYSIVYYLRNYGEYWNYAIRAEKAADDSVKDYENASGSYKNSFDAASLQSTEDSMITEMNKIYFGIGV